MGAQARGGRSRAIHRKGRLMFIDWLVDLELDDTTPLPIVGDVAAAYATVQSYGLITIFARPSPGRSVQSLARLFSWRSALMRRETAHRRARAKRAAYCNVSVPFANPVGVVATASMRNWTVQPSPGVSPGGEVWLWACSA